jgi:DNA-directed RNA polymerase subunit M/transcription elongation factor TFIIS
VFFLAKLFLVNQGNLDQINNPIFSSGDVYLLDDERTIYVWIGNKCSVDEKTAGAAQARSLDQQRGGAAKIITVDQGLETKEFMKLISSMGAMKIVEKNVAKTMLKDVVTGDYAQFAEHVNVLYRVSSEEFEGINAMKMIQVPYNNTSLDTEDCFVLDLGNKVYVWQGNACNVKEKVKAGQWAREIDLERAGLQNETIFEEGDDGEFLAALEKGEYYKESDAVQLRAESILEPETEADRMVAAIQPEHKAEVRDITPDDIRADINNLKTASASSAGPGIPGKVDDSILTIEKSEGRRKCPKCGNENKLLIHESIDKSNIIMDYPRMYGKKYRCGECGLEWREK